MRRFTLALLSAAVALLTAQTISYFQVTNQTPGGTSTSVQDAVLIDFDSDGDLDYVVASLNSGGTAPLKAWRNDGTGKFTEATAAVFGANPPTVEHERDMEVADFNGDGRADLFIADHGYDAYPFAGGQNRILIQTADGRLVDETATRLPQERRFSHNSSAGDIDGDGDIDIYVANIWSSNGCGHSLLINNGQGVFTKDQSRLPALVTECIVNFTAAEFIDIDNDGDLDVFVGSMADPNQPAKPKDNLLINDGKGNFTVAPDSALPNRYKDQTWLVVGITKADVNNDGYMDVLLAVNKQYGSGTAVQLLINNGNGTFRDATYQLPGDYQNDAWIKWVTAGDLNNDGLPDLVLSSGRNNSRVLLNTGGGQFAKINDLIPLPSADAGLQPLSWARIGNIHLGDLNKDGRLDLLMTPVAQERLIVAKNLQNLPAVSSCGYNLSQTALNAAGVGESGTLTVSAGTDCRWSASSSAPWLQVSSVSANSINYTVLPNGTGAARSAVLAAAGKMLTVTQEPAPCTLSLSPTTVSAPQEGAFDSIAVTTSAPYCEWSAASAAAWVQLYPQRSGTGNGSFQYFLPGNNGPSRSSVIQVGAASVAVSQVGIACTYTLSAAGAAVLPAGRSGTFAVTASNSSCSWSATSSASWLSASGSGTGDGSVTWTAAANTGAAARTATIAVGSQTYTVMQTAVPPCTFTVTPGSVNTSQTGSTGTVALTASAPTCAWTASSSASWAQVFPLSGAGSGTISYTVFPNFGTAQRTGTFTIGGQTVNYAQAGNPLTADERFIDLIYFSFMGRLPSAEERAFQLNSGLHGGLTRTDLAMNFLNSAEFNAGGRFVAGLYVGLLDRDAEFGGWLFQRNALFNGQVSQVQQITNFLNAPEYSLRFGSPTNDQFVTLLYQKVLLRNPAAAEVSFQSGALASGTSRTTLAQNFLNSQEFRIGTGPRLTAFLLFATLLQRQPADGEFVFYRNSIANGTAVTGMVDSFVKSAEFAASLK